MDAMATNNGHMLETTVSPTRPTLPLSVLVCTGVSGSLSILGAFIIFISFCILDRNHLNQTRWLLLWLTIADFMNCAGIMLGLVRYILTYTGQVEDESNCINSNSLCVVQSFITTFSAMCSFFWTIFIGIHLSVSVVQQREFASRRGIQITGHIICWGIPLGITIAAKIENVLGETFSATSGPWCWIRDCIDHTWYIIWMTIAGKGWEILMYISSIYLYGHYKWVIWKQRNANGQTYTSIDGSHDTRHEDEIYAYLPLVLYALRAWGTARFGMTIARHDYPDTPPAFDTADNILLHFQSIGDSLQAFCNCILFCFVDKTVRQALFSRLTCRNTNNVDVDETRGLLENDNTSRNTRFPSVNLN